MRTSRRKTDGARLRVPSFGFAVALVMAAAGPASAEGLFDAIFGALSGRPHTPPIRAHGYADPNNDGGYGSPRRPRQAQHAGGGGQAYCVRLCDGRYFPMQRHANATPVQLCSAMCPAARVKIFSGSAIARATAQDGTRYEDLDNAFTYRERIVDNCTCNGKDAFGLAPIDVNSDPTLRTGDFVATANGLMAYAAAPRSRRPGDVAAANFTPVDTARLSRGDQEKLANMAVAKQN